MLKFIIINVCCKVCRTEHGNVVTYKNIQELITVCLIFLKNQTFGLED